MIQSYNSCVVLLRQAVDWSAAKGIGKRRPGTHLVPFMSSSIHGPVNVLRTCVTLHTVVRTPGRHARVIPHAEPDAGGYFRISAINHVGARRMARYLIKRERGVINTTKSSYVSRRTLQLQYLIGIIPCSMQTNQSRISHCLPVSVLVSTQASNGSVWAF